MQKLREENHLSTSHVHVENGAAYIFFFNSFIVSLNRISFHLMYQHSRSQHTSVFITNTHPLTHSPRILFASLLVFPLPNGILALPFSNQQKIGKGSGKAGENKRAGWKENNILQLIPAGAEQSYIWAFLPTSIYKYTQRKYP